MKKFFLIVIFLLLITLPFLNTFAQSTSQSEELQKKIADYENKLVEIRKQKNTLATQIQLMDTQIYLTILKIQETEKKIETTQKEIELLDSKIENLDTNLDNLLKTFIAKVNNDYKKRNYSIFSVILEANNFADFFRKIKYIQSTREANKELILKVQQAKANYQEQKKLREEKTTYLENLKVTLNNQKAELNNQKLSKQKLLIETNNDELTYQRLLSQARAQLASLASFVSQQGGASLLFNQTSCDDWGCYYNQRDSQWGNYVVNNSYDCYGACSVAKIGCLITSVAMLATYNGFNINPLDIAKNSSNFYLTTALLNKGTIYANGKSIYRYSVNSNYLTPELLNNGPVIVGINHGDFGTHFLIIKSYQDGKYIMNDPYIENGKNKVFTDYYSLSSIFSVERISVN